VATVEKTPDATQPVVIEMPAPTAWPIILALGFTLVFAGLLTSASVSALGAILAIAGCIGWFRDVLPHEHHEEVRVVAKDVSFVTARPSVDRVAITSAQTRAWLPIETYPISAGVKGGVAGSVAMAALACTYGLWKMGSIWYPINLLAAAVYSQSIKYGDQLFSFHADSFILACVIHGVVSLLVGLLYGAMLPMFPRRPIILGGLVAPVVWSALIYAILGILNPLLESKIDWWWFLASQSAFGIVAGFVVIRQSRVPTRENVPWVLRAGLEAPGTMREHDHGSHDGSKQP
jgi:hypothetical protein